MLSEVSGFALDVKRIDGSVLNTLYSMFRLAVAERSELARQRDVSPYIVEKPLRKGERLGQTYVKFAFEHLDEAQGPLFANPNKEIDFLEPTHVVINHNRPLVLIHPGRYGTQRDFDLVEKLFGKRLSFTQTHHYEPEYGKTYYFDTGVFVANTTKRSVEGIDIRRIEGDCSLWQLGFSVDPDMERPGFTAQGAAKIAGMGIAIVPMEDHLKTSSPPKWVLSVHTNHWDQGNLKSDASAFRSLMCGYMEQFAIPDTCVAIGHDYSGSHPYLFTPKTNLRKIVEIAAGGASMREVGHGTSADSTKRLIGLYLGLLEAPGAGPKYAAGLREAAEEMRQSAPDSVKGFLLEWTLEEMAA